MRDPSVVPELNDFLIDEDMHGLFVEAPWKSRTGLHYLVLYDISSQYSGSNRERSVKASKCGGPAIGGVCKANFGYVSASQEG